MPTVTSNTFNVDISGAVVDGIFGPYDHESESVGDVGNVLATWTRVANGFGPDCVIQVQNNPLTAGSAQNLYCEVEKQGTASFRTERRLTAAPNEAPMTSAGSDDYVATQEYWYGTLFRLDDYLDQATYGVGDPAFPNSHIIQWHNNDSGVLDDKSPPFSLKVGHLGDGQYGLIARLERNDDNGGSNFVSSKLMDLDIGVTKSLIFRIKWDTRTGASSTGLIRVYSSTSAGNPGSPIFSWDGQTCHPGIWATDNNTAPAAIPYFKIGIYASEFKFGGDNGDYRKASYDNIVVAGENTNETGMNNAVWSGVLP